MLSPYLKIRTSRGQAVVGTQTNWVIKGEKKVVGYNIYVGTYNTNKAGKL